MQSRRQVITQLARCVSSPRGPPVQIGNAVPQRFSGLAILLAVTLTGATWSHARCEQLASGGVWVAESSKDAIGVFGTIGRGTFAMLVPAGASHLLLQVENPDWKLHGATPVVLHIIFAGGVSLAFRGDGRDQVVQATIPDSEVRAWTHNFTAASLMTVTFQGIDEPAWSIPLAGTTPTVNAMAKALEAAGVTGLPPPWNTGGQDGHTDGQPVPSDEVSGVRPPSTQSSAPADVEKLALLDSELSRAVAIYVAGVRGGPTHTGRQLTLRQWLEAMFRNPRVKSVTADRVWIDSIFPRLVIHVRMKENDMRFGFGFVSDDDELVLRYFQLQPGGAYYIVSRLSLGEQVILGQALNALAE